MPRLRIRPRLAAAPALLSLLTLGHDAAASVWDVAGFGPEGMASVSARAASATDGSAAFYNPAGLAFATGYRLGLSGTGMFSLLDAQDARQPVRDPVGANLALDADVPLEGPLDGRLRFGVAMHALASKLMRLQVHRSTDPFFPYFDNRTQRLTLIPALALRPTKELGLGAGVNVLAGVSGPVDLREGQSRGLETSFEQNARTVASWVVGARVEPVDGVSLAAVYRQAFGVPFRVTTTANVAGVPLTADVGSAQALFDPAAVVLAASLAASDRWQVEVDGAWHRWSAWEGPLLTLDTTVSALTMSSHSPAGLYRDTWGGRVAARWTVSATPWQRTSLVAGAGYETSMLDPSVAQGRTNFLDGAKTILGIGVKARFPGFVGEAIGASIGCQWQRVSPTVQSKQVCTQVPCPPGTVVGPDTDRPDRGISNPGFPVLSGGGSLFVLSAGLEVQW